jgi:hypothetical protein
MKWICYYPALCVEYNGLHGVTHPTQLIKMGSWECEGARAHINCPSLALVTLPSVDFSSVANTTSRAQARHGPDHPCQRPYIWYRSYSCAVHQTKGINIIHLYVGILYFASSIRRYWPSRWWKFSWEPLLCIF